MITTMPLDSIEPKPNTTERAEWMVTTLGLTIDEALRATHFPCTKTHLYRRVKAARDAIVESVKEGTQEIIREVALSEETTDLWSLTQTPPRRSKRKKRTSSSVTRSTLQRIEEEGAIHTRDKKTLKAIEEAVQDGVDSFLSSHSSIKRSVTCLVREAQVKRWH
mmetsp:Transcript_17679/g.35685  ORF Transcript_17679/g.35685 Transcript_17679/m.35685 type:complete len:164 (+) Transcript_17679:60-551(+)